jgi:putative endonuclease
MSKQYWVYILASKKDGTLYIGVTSLLIKRVGDHKDDVIEGFTKRYGVHRLVYFEEFGDVQMAIAREKQLKGWNRAWKIKLIEKNNPNWSDLYPSLLG